MYRRFLLRLFSCSLLILLAVCTGCAAQSDPQNGAPSALAQKVETHVRAYYKLPSDVQVSVGPLHSSDFPGYDAVSVTIGRDREKKQTLEFLVSKDQQTLLHVTKMDLTKDPYLETMNKIDISNRPVRGNPNAKVTVVNFDDFQCPFCSRMHQTLFPELLKEYGDRVKFVYKDFPLVELHPWAMHAAVDANCLAAQSPDAYWDFADYIHANQREVNSEKSPDAQFAAVDRIVTAQGLKHNIDQAKLQACIKAQNTDAIKASIKEGEDLDLSATPVLYVNGQQVEGAVPASEMRATLDAALARAGVPNPKPAPPAAAPASAPTSAPPAGDMKPPGSK
jgi:protein-disulfide isomerase